MRFLFLAAAIAASGTAHPAVAQGANTSMAQAGGADGRIALSSRSSSAATQPMRLACALIIGKVFEANGEPLRGATLVVKGTHQVYVTDSEGKFQFTDPVYEGQILTIGAAGYVSREIPLADCSLPRLVLAKAPTARIKQTGKRAGQVVRLNNRSTILK
ncbi:hypothetical protein BEN47_01190 [Hymenobacter lapidarius]|uniref:TonB-dependent receptor plug domain-containing protein n=1 Tax=Hymenobacter lapidarius TaxID=1908237 RepID=A0A1G1T5R3_9BACT|nr:carboxypeptidase-like regulatory domain-containing protein [Hymenobacter lapidarius]OGX86201.1 hypothetical protein BEN47_01190 [Hymenobacter lapidarius]